MGTYFLGDPGTLDWLSTFPLGSPGNLYWLESYLLGDPGTLYWLAPGGTVWPSTLPQKFIVDGYSEEETELVIKSEVAAAFPQLRRPNYASAQPFGGKMILDDAQRQQLDSFWDANCSSRFLFPRPYSGEPIFVRFIDRPNISAASGDLYCAEIKLEEVQ